MLFILAALCLLLTHCYLILYCLGYETYVDDMWFIPLTMIRVLILAMMPCVRADELVGDHLCYVTSVKYLGVVLDATKCLIDHISSCF